MDDVVLRTQAHTLKPQTIEYFRSIEEVIDEQPFVEDEEGQSLDALVENLYEEVKGNEEALFLNRHTSRTLEKLFLATSDYGLLKSCLWSVRHQFFALSRGRCSSHPIQAILSHVPAILRKESPGGLSTQEDRDLSQSFSDEWERDVKMSEPPSDVYGSRPIQEILSCLCEGFVNHFIDLMFDPFASFILRDFTDILGGAERLQGKEKKKGKVRRDVSFAPENSEKILSEISEKLLNSEEIDWEQLSFDQHAGPVLQHLLSALHAHGLSALIEQFIGKILYWDFDSDTQCFEVSESSEVYVHSFICDRSGSHLMQQVIETASENVIQLLFSHHFRSNFVEFSLHKCGNFCVQSLISRFFTEKQVKKAFKKLKTSFGDLFDYNKTGVLWRLCEASLRLNVCQEEIFQRIHKYVCKKSKNSQNFNFVLFLLNLSSKVNSEYTDIAQGSISRGTRNSRFNWGGASLLQTLLKFHSKTIKDLLRSFLHIDSDTLYNICIDSLGSRVFGAYLTSGDHTNKKKVMINRLSGRFSMLSRNAFGSFCVEKCLIFAVPKQKLKIAKELIESFSALSGNHFGRIIVSKFDLQSLRDEPENTENWLKHAKHVEVAEKQLALSSQPSSSLAAKKRNRSPAQASTELPKSKSQKKRKISKTRDKKKS